MKKIVAMLMVLLMITATFAEAPGEPILPVKIIEHEHAKVLLADALTAAMYAVDKVPEQARIRAELVEMSDGSKIWVVNIFDYDNFLDAWCIAVDAAAGKVLTVEYGQCGDFAQNMAQWTQVKGPYVLWSLEDKQLYDRLYYLTPSLGLPMEGDMSAEQALSKALLLFGLTSADGYDIGYEFIQAGEGCNGIWCIYLVKDGQVAYRVNLDAVNGEVYYMETNLQDADEANG